MNIVLINHFNELYGDCKFSKISLGHNGIINYIFKRNNNEEIVITFDIDLILAETPNKNSLLCFLTRPLLDGRKRFLTFEDLSQSFSKNYFLLNELSCEHILEDLFFEERNLIDISIIARKLIEYVNKIRSCTPEYEFLKNWRETLALGDFTNLLLALPSVMNFKEFKAAIKDIKTELTSDGNIQPESKTDAILGLTSLFCNGKFPEFKSYDCMKKEYFIMKLTKDLIAQQQK